MEHFGWKDGGGRLFRYRSSMACRETAAMGHPSASTCHASMSCRRFFSSTSFVYKDLVASNPIPYSQLSITSFMDMKVAFPFFGPVCPQL
jgi:hypothetical protein